MSVAKEKFIRRMEALRSSFEAKLGERLIELEGVIGELNTKNSSAGVKASLENLHMLSHKLGGAASTFGFSHVANLAQELEQLSVDALKNIGASLPVDFLKVNELLKSLRVIHDFDDKSSMIEGTSWQVVLEELGTRKEVENTILLVDDDPTLLKVLEEQLTDFGFKIRSISDVSELPREVDAHPPAAIIMDIMIPGKEDAGVIAIQELKKKGVLTCPVIFLSARGDFKARLGAVRAGCDGYLVKPVDIIELVDTLNRFTNIPEEFAYRVVVVDDDSDVAERNALLLDNVGMEAKVVTDPMSVLATIREVDPDAILMDINMPGCNGFELASVIRQDKKYLQIPIIFLTAEGGLERKYAAMRSGSDEFLEKSGKPELLVASVLARARRSRNFNALISELKESETRFRAVAQTAVDAIVSVDQKGRIIFWNAAAQSIFGYEPSEILGKPFTQIIAESSHPTLGTSFQQAKITEGKNLVGNTAEMEGLRKDNSTVPIEISLAEWIFGEGTFLSAIIRNITDRKEAEEEIKRLNKNLEIRVVERTEELRANEHLLQKVFDTLPLPVYIKDLEYRYIRVNPALEAVYDLPAEQIINRTAEDITTIAVEDGDLIQKQDRQVITTGESLDLPEFEFTDGKGNLHTTHIRKVPLRDEDGHITGLVGISEDITARKQAEEALRQSHEMLEQRVEERTRELTEEIAERKQAEEALRENRELLQALADNIPDFITFKDLDGRFQFVNQCFENWVDIDRKDVIGKTVHDIYPPEDAKVFAAEDRQVIESKKVQSMEKILDFADGKTRNVISTRFPVLLSSGDVLGLGTINIDVTNRTEAEEEILRLNKDLENRIVERTGELRESEKLLRTVFEAMPHHLYVKDLNGVFQMGNRQFLDYWGIDPDKITNYKSDDLPVKNEDLKKNFRESDQITLKEGKTFVGIIEFEDKDGIKSIRRHIKVPHLNDSGEIIGVIGLSEDVTRQMQAEEALRESEELFQTMFEALPQAVYVMGLDDRYIRVNRALENLHDLPADQILKRTVEEIRSITGEDGAHFREQDRHVLTTGESLNLPEFEITDGKGNLQIRHIYKVPLRDKEGNIAGLVGISEDITKSKRAEEALEKSQKLMAKAQEVAHLGAVEWEVGIKNQYWSDETFRIVGYEPQAFQPSEKKFADTLHSEDKKRVLTAFNEALERKDSIEVECRIVRPDGEERVVQIRIEIIRDDSDVSVHLIGTVLDITEQKIIEGALEKSQKLMTKAQEVAHLGAMEWDVITNKQYWSDEVFRIIGLEPQEFQPDSNMFAKMLHPDDKKRVLTSMGEAVAARKAVNIVCRVVQPDGTERFVRAQGDFDWEQSKISNHFVGTIQDITEQKQAEEAIRKSEAQVRMLLDSTAEAIYGIDTEGRCTLVNPACMKMLGYEDAGEIHGKNMHDLIHHTREDGNPYPVEECHILRSYRTGEKVHVEDEVLWRKDGSSFSAEYWSYPIVQEEKVFGAVVTFFDITDRKKIEMELLQSQKMEAVGQLTGGVAHDFNNILQIISGHSQIARSINDDDRVLKHLDLVVDAVQRAADLTQQLLAFSRQQVHKPQNIDINGVISKLVKMLSRVISENIELHLNLAEDLTKINADASMLEQVLLNLCVNSRDAMANGGKLTISTSTFESSESFRKSNPWADSREYCLISVSDTGEGMPPDVVKKIFDPFYTTKPVGKGTGLGLSMVFGIIQQHRGNITASSKVGIGTTFKIYLPVGSEGQEPMIEEKQIQEVSGGTETILVVEDDEGVLHLMTYLLKKKDYKILACSNGVEALSILKKRWNEIDLIILDVIMPQMGGREVFDNIKDNKPSIPVIFSTGYKNEQFDEDFLLKNNLKTISKPFSPIKLYRAIRQSLDIR